MGQPAAKKGDQVVGVDTHILVHTVTSVTTPLPLPFVGKIDAELSDDVKIEGEAAATVGSKASNDPQHIEPPSMTFASPPSNEAEIISGSASVTINGKAAARLGDTALTCNDPTDMPVGTVVAVGKVLIG